MRPQLASVLAFLSILCGTSVAAERRTPILGPFDNNTSSPPPSYGTIRSALPKGTAVVPFVLTTTRLRDSLAPPRFYPLVGQAQLHQVHWRCTLFALEPSLFPLLPIRLRPVVVYIDQDRLHLVQKKN